MKRATSHALSLLVAIGLVLAITTSGWAIDTLQDVMKRRGLSEQDVLAAAKTYVPSGKRDEYYVFASGGQVGQVIVYGVPSMRILKYIGVFTPDPWQGYGYDEESKAILKEGFPNGKEILWGDAHHPALSETNGVYDGQFLFINDKATPRIAVIDLTDFETKQIVSNPIFMSEHGGVFVTPNTEYLIEATQYPAPLDKKFAPLESFNEDYRGGMTFWKFDRSKGRIDPAKSFSFELPPYSQDLSDAGKGPSNGWAFTNSFCSERYVGGVERGRPPFEAGCSANDTDFLHVINWVTGERIVAQGKAKTINGHKVIPMDVAVKEGALFLIPEPKSPHGVDVTPDGKYIVVSGKLDTHVSVYSWEKILAAIKAHRFEGKDPYGIPILSMRDTLHTQVQVGLGPLHTQFDSKPCVAYTSLYVDSQVAKWDYCQGRVLDKIAVQYNIGHLATMEGDTMKPKGKYLIALNKLSIDRFLPVGPLHPQNHQLIDISGDKMQLLYDMPIGLGEPHYAVAIAADKLKPGIRYKLGTDSRTMKPSPGAAKSGEEKVVKKGKHVIVYGTMIRSHIVPEIIDNVEVGDDVTIYMTNLERAEDETHGFTVSDYNAQMSVEPGKTASIKIKADREGVYPYYCTEFCSALHLEMEGYLLVKPKGWKATKVSLKEGQAYTKADYEKQYKTNLETQAVIDQVVGWITSHNYKDFPEAAALVEDATDQLNKAPEVKAKMQEAVKKQDWQNATLWAGQWWQYQVKAADIGLRAKAYLEEHGAKKVK
jgi:nitrous-oxide reductase